MEADFIRDWANYLVAQLTRSSCHVDPTRDPEELAVAFFNALAHRPPVTPRRVLVSREFACPLACQAGVDLIKDKSERGEDLTPHLSMAIEKDSDVGDRLFNDALLNDWGIHHLHLGTTPDPRNPSFVARTDDVLFARITDDTLYMIAVMPHGNWARQDLVEIIHRNWPGSIRRFRLQGVVGLDPALRDDQIAKLRKRYIIAIQMRDGTVYRPIGGGCTTSGVGVEVADRAAYFCCIVRWLEKHVRENASRLVAEAATQGHTLGPRLRFRLLALVSESAYVIEDNSKVVFCVPLGR